MSADVNTRDAMKNRLTRMGYTGSTADMLAQFHAEHGVTWGTVHQSKYASQAPAGYKGFADSENQFWDAGVLNDAVFWVDAGKSRLSGGKLSNLGTGGSALDAQFGSTAPSAYFNGTALVLPGVAGNYASTPDAPALDITGNLCLVADVAPTDWTPGSTVRLGGKDNAYVLNLNTTGQLGFTYLDSGSVLRTAATSAPLGFTDGVRRQVAVTYIAGTGVNDVRFWTRNTSSDPWVQFGTTQSSGGVGIRVGGNAAAFGATDTGTAPLTGSLYRFTIYASVGASNEPPSSGAVFDADFAKPFDTTSFTATTGQTVTLTRSTSGSDTNDPTLLPHTGTNYLALTGGSVGQNYASIPDAAALDILGDIEVVMRVSATDWTPATNQGCFASRQTLVDPNRAWMFRLNVGGTLAFNWFPTGSAASQIVASSTVVAPFADGSVVWLKVTLDVNNGAGGKDVKFWYAADQATEPTSWTQLGATVTTAGTTSLPNVTSPMHIGFFDGSTDYLGNIYRTIVRNGIGGSTVVDIDFTTGITSGGQTTFTASTGQTVTINRATSGRKAVAVTRPIVLMGTDDYFEVPDNALLNFGATDLGTVIAVVRLWNTEAAGMALINKRDATAVAPAGPGWNLRIGGGVADTQFVTYDGTTSPQSGPAGTWTAGALTLHGGSFNGSSNQQWAFRNTSFGSTITSAVNTLTNTQTVRIGSLSNGASPLNGELVAVAVFRRALTAAEISSIVSYYGAA